MSNNFNSIDQYNLFDLMGLAKMTSSQKKAMLVNINTLIWNDFLGQRLNLLLTHDQLIVVKKKLENKEKIDQILDYIAKVAPNIFNLMDEFTKKYKFEYIRHHFLLMLDEYTRLADKIENNQNGQANEKERQKYTQAIKLLDEYQWDELVKLFT